MDIIKAIAKEFPQKDIIHLNHAGIAPWPQCAVRAIYDFALENAEYGSLNANCWSQRVTELRQMLCDLINAESSDEIALVKNTSEGLSFIAHGIDWQPDDNIVVAMQEFPSNRVVWEALETCTPVQTRIIDLYASLPEQALVNAIDRNTRLLATSSIQYATGYRMDLEYLGKICHEQNILFCVDGIQSLGATPLDVQACHIDFLSADAHKWLLGPEGIGLLYCQKRHLPSLKLYEYGWNMLQNSDDYDTLYSEPAALSWTIQSNAQRFECGSHNHLGIYALHASLNLLMNRIGLETVYQSVRRNVDYLASNLDATKFKLLTPNDVAHRGGILTVQALKQDNQVLFRHLIANRVLCAYRGGGVRLSPHFYTSTNQLDYALELLSYTNN